MSAYLCSISEAVERLNHDDVVGLPTETVYGLAGRIDRPQAINRIFAVKQRPFFDPLIVHVASIQQAKSIVREWPDVAQELAGAFWPGPLTLVLEKNSLISDLITSGLSSVGIRWPAHPLAQELIQSVGVPLAAPSANLFGHTSPTLASHVLAEFSQEKIAVLDGGPCQIGIESTVLSLKKISDQWHFSILRPGLISGRQIQDLLLRKKIVLPETTSINRKESPGQMKHHYMPSKPLIVSFLPHLDDQRIVEIFLQRISEIPDVIEGVKIRKPTGTDLTITRLQLSTDSSQAARQLYAELRRASSEDTQLLFLDLSGHLSAKLEENSSDANWIAIYERIHKAATLVLK